VTGAMIAIYETKLGWRPRALPSSNDSVFVHWDWGAAWAAESLTALQNALSLDPRLHVLICTRAVRLRTPYFATALMLRALPDVGSGGSRAAGGLIPAPHVLYRRRVARGAAPGCDDAVRRTVTAGNVPSVPRFPIVWQLPSSGEAVRGTA